MDRATLPRPSAALAKGRAVTTEAAPTGRFVHVRPGPVADFILFLSWPALVSACLRRALHIYIQRVHAFG
jgi:hypothetical protein